MSKVEVMIRCNGALVQFIDKELVNIRDVSILHSERVPVAEAVHRLSTGQRVIVANMDMGALWKALGATPVDDGPASLNEVVNEHYPEDWV
jgi:hypothetical protein